MLHLYGILTSISFDIKVLALLVNYIHTKATVENQYIPRFSQNLKANKNSKIQNVMSYNLSLRRLMK